MDTVQVTPDFLSAMAGIILSLVFSYVPSLNVWFAGKAPDVKRLVMFGIMAVVGIAIGGLSCASVIVAVPCTQAGWIVILKAVIAAGIANQAAYALTPQTAAVKLSASAAKLASDTKTEKPA